MSMPINILLQTTIPFTENDWHIGCFSLLKKHLESLKDDNGDPLYSVMARDSDEDETGNDRILKDIDASDFDELWLFAVDTGDGLSTEDCEAVTRFRKRGGGILSTRDHNDLGSSLCTIGGVGAAHYFHSKNPDPDPTRCCRDDEDNPDIDYPNYHSGANGDYQNIDVAVPHELLTRPDGASIEYFPAHPHEGGIGSPNGNDWFASSPPERAKPPAGRSILLLRLMKRVMVPDGQLPNRVFIISWIIIGILNQVARMGITEAPGDGYKRHPEALNDIKQYVENVARWLKPA